MSENIKNIIVKKSNLPSFNGKNASYTIRYKVVSSDGNRTSHWSIPYTLTFATPTQIQCVTNVTDLGAQGKTLSAIWVSDSKTTSFDIYIKWTTASASTDAWKHMSTVSNTQWTTLIPANALKYQIAIQVPTQIKERYAKATLFLSTEIAV